MNSVHEPGSLIFNLELTPGIDNATLQHERNRWAKQHTSMIVPKSDHANDRTPDRKLRIGYVSADFREHSAAYVFGGMLIHFDRANFEVFAYSNCELEDGITRQFQESVTCWRNIHRMSDDEAAAVIVKDKIDILVDLSGHSGGNRLLLFARKPAPIQCTGWGYATSTGLKAIDYFFTDRFCVPESERHYYTEKVSYLPCLVSSWFPFRFPEVGPPPALKKGYVTFGCFNRLAKISDMALDAWCEILRRLPAARMIIKCGEFDKPENKYRIRDFFISNGIEADRFSLIGVTPKLEHIASFNMIDIALDPFPQCGGVTALEGLMMGVPLVVMRGDTITGRGASSILSNIHCKHWIANTVDEYVDIALSFSDYNDLEFYREVLRHNFKYSMVGDTTKYVQYPEMTYREMWREYLQ